MAALVEPTTPKTVDKLLSHTVSLAGALTAGVGKAPHFAEEAAKDSHGGGDAASAQLREHIRALAADVTAASAAIDREADAVAAAAEYGAASKSSQLSEIAALQREHEKVTSELRLAGNAALSSLRGLRHVQHVALGESVGWRGWAVVSRARAAGGNKRCRDAVNRRRVRLSHA